MTGTGTKASSLPRARTAGVFYLLTILTGAFAAFASGKFLMFADAASLAATACYIVVTLLFYGIFKPVDSSLSLIAAVFSLVGCGLGVLSVLHLVPSYIKSVNPLVLFGCYCVLIGYLIFRSSFLPRVLGVLMAFGGLGWLTFGSSTLADALTPYNLAPGILGEGALTVWLLAKGVNAQRWQEQASTGGFGTN
ncbi:MAG TPA: DUF4386 domain-containing protein [Candidatus Acidoferrum sp.]|nr:DUF4386 domain-containing protein [Candidatus Acidoferrum sp.]